MSVLLSVLLTLRCWVRSRAVLQLEMLALRHQLEVLQRSRPPPPIAWKTGPVPVGLAVAGLDELALGPRHRPTGDGYRVASPRLPLVVDLEKSAAHGQTDRVG
jgi:hypothetical protein